MVGGGSTKLTFRFLDSISVLGNQIDDVGSADTQLQNRLASADRAVWLKMKTWKSKADRDEKLAAWIRYVHPIVLHGLRSVHVNRITVQTIKTWENKWLRKILGYRRRVWKNEAGETVLEKMDHYHRRINKNVKNAYQKANGKPLHEKAVEGIFKEAWRLKDFKIHGLNGGADYIRGLRSKMWWETIKSYRPAKGIKVTQSIEEVDQPPVGKNHWSEVWDWTGDKLEPK